MNTIECLRIMRKAVCLLLIWNVLITSVMVGQYAKYRADKLSEQICALEEIPQYDIVEVE